jgi:hypothetical protein
VLLGMRLRRVFGVPSGVMSVTHGRHGVVGRLFVMAAASWCLAASPWCRAACVACSAAFLWCSAAFLDVSCPVRLGALPIDATRRDDGRS